MSKSSLNITNWSWVWFPRQWRKFVDVSSILKFFRTSFGSENNTTTALRRHKRRKRRQINRGKKSAEYKKEYNNVANCHVTKDRYIKCYICAKCLRAGGGGNFRGNDRQPHIVHVHVVTHYVRAAITENASEKETNGHSHTERKREKANEKEENDVKRNVQYKQKSKIITRNDKRLSAVRTKCTSCRRNCCP